MTSRIRLTIAVLCLLGFETAQSKDSMKCNQAKEFFMNLGTTMFVTTQCPQIGLNRNAIVSQITRLDIDLRKPEEFDTICPGIRKSGLMGGLTLAVMMNDAGGPFPCDKILSPPGEKALDWEQFVTRKDVKER